MSLVNDMLRDLDARRRDAPRQGTGTDRLIPASGESGHSRHRLMRRIMVAAVLLLAAVAGIALAMYLTTTRSDGGASSSPVTVAPGAAVPGVGEVPLNEDGNAADAAGEMPDRTERQLDSLSRRLNELEQENRDLRQRTEVLAETMPADVAPQSPSMQPAPPQSSQPQSSSLQPPTQSPEARTGGAPAATAGITRTPREPSFRERDRNQVQQALTLWSEGQRTEALQLLDQFALENPQAHLSREMLGKLLIERGEPAIAMQVADIGLQIAPLHNGYRKLKSRLLLARNEPAEALQLLEEDTPSLDADTEYHDLLASAALAAGAHETARFTYEQLLRQDDSQGRWWYGLAVALENLDQPRQALQAYERALRAGTLSAGLRQRSQDRIDQLRPGS